MLEKYSPNMDAINKIIMCNQIYSHYQKILDSYVSDFYIEKHWNKLLKSWQTFLENMNVGELGAILDFDAPMYHKVFPLSLICLKQLINVNIISRKQVELPSSPSAFSSDENFMNFFWKNVKLKKRHEINLISQMCQKSAVKTGCFHIVDIGSGVGHLSRMLSYGYGFKVCTFDADYKLVELAKELDDQFECRLEKRSIAYKNTFKTVHNCKRIEANMTSNEFLNLIKESFEEDEFYFGIVGLHPCGNLGPTLLRLYTECKNAVFINIASCCYNKLSLTPSESPGFPLSNFCKINNYKLSYLSCEIACHAIENYIEKLKTNDYNYLKIHAYRAGLESILEIAVPLLRHSPLRSIKYNTNLSFKSYCEMALKCESRCLPNDEILVQENIIEKTWNNVVAFYSTRLLLAPVVETIILLDRMLYIQESGSECDVLPLFESSISPRNHVLYANKRNL